MRKIYSHSQMLTKNGKDQRRRRNQKNQKKTCATFPTTDAFLKQSFGSINAFGTRDSLEAFQVTKQIKRSLEYLHRLHRLPPVQLPSLAFPKNLYQAFGESEALLYQQQPALHVELMQDDKGKYMVATIQELDTKMTLFYLPLKALWILHRQKNTEAFQILLGIYSYLYHQAGMATFQSGNYIWDTCECIEEYLINDETDIEKEELFEIKQEFTRFRRIAPILNKAITDPTPFGRLPTLINEYQAFTPFASTLKNIAVALVNLHKACPNELFIQNLSSRWLYEQDEEPTYVEQYFSFCWSDKGWLMEQLESHVNVDLQEKSFLDVPCSVQLFDRPQKEVKHTMFYQEKILDLLNQLSALLNDNL